MRRKMHYVLPSACNATDNALDVLCDVYVICIIQHGSSKHHPQLRIVIPKPTPHTSTKYKLNNLPNSPIVLVTSRIRYIRGFVYSGHDNVIRLIGLPVKGAINAYMQDAYQMNVQISLRNSMRTHLSCLVIFTYTSVRDLKKEALNILILEEKNIPAVLRLRFINGAFRKFPN